MRTDEKSSSSPLRIWSLFALWPFSLFFLSFWVKIECTIKPVSSTKTYNGDWQEDFSSCVFFFCFFIKTMQAEKESSPFCSQMYISAVTHEHISIYRGDTTELSQVSVSGNLWTRHNIPHHSEMCPVKILCFASVLENSTMFQFDLFILDLFKATLHTLSFYGNIEAHIPMSVINLFCSSKNWTCSVSDALWSENAKTQIDQELLQPSASL